MITLPKLAATPAIVETIHDLIALGFVPLPVAPIQDAEKYPATDHNGQVIRDADGTPRPRFNGKNPSYLDADGRPHLVAHTRYRIAQPTDRDMVEWWGNPANGIGTNRGCWLDIDAKNFESPEALSAAVADLVERAEWVERTQSGGYRILIDPTETPDFTNFGIGDVKHAGELRHSGGFVVLAPTVGVNGTYTRIKTGAPLRCDRVEDLGIKPTRVKPTKAAPQPTAALDMAPPVAVAKVVHQASPEGLVSLVDLVSKSCAKILNGNIGSDPSNAIATVARELYGWENLAASEGIILGDSADDLITGLADTLGRRDKLEAMLAPISRAGCTTGLENRRGVEAAIATLRAKSGLAVDDGDILISSTDSPGSVAVDRLYSRGDYVNIGGGFYRWVGTHYEKCEDATERGRIRAVLNRCLKCEESQHGVKISRPWRSAPKLTDAYGWALASVPYIPVEEINPSGLNLTNGVLVMRFGADGVPVPELLEHSPDRIYTYAPQVTYNPSAPTEDCDRLLEALPSHGKEAVLRVLAAAVDLDSVRRAKGRAVRALIFTGSGANGKDALREAITYVYGRNGVTSATIDDFHAYDQGRKFNLASLAGSRINWASENRVGVNIDEIQSLKQLITGDPLIAEEKFLQGSEFTPRCIAIFSTNDRAVNLTASLEAISSRYCIIPFRKTFVANPKGPNEIKADSRFKYSPDWVREVVCPALLNILIAQYQAIFTEGIDYAPFDEAMAENRLEANHLFRFAADCNLIADDSAWVTNAELWQRLRNWYEDEGILKINDDGRETWEADVRAGDTWVRGSQQLKKRLSKIFANIGTYHNGKQRGIKGIRFVSQAEVALLDCDSIDAYQSISFHHGQDAINAAWPLLPPEVQGRITAVVEAAKAQPEANPEAIDAEVAILREAVADRDKDAIAEILGSMDEITKKAAWAKLSPEEKSAIWLIKAEGVSDGT